MEVHGRIPVQRRRPLIPTWVAKSLMAVTGLLMAAFVFIHMVGNIKIFIDPAGLDSYALWLREVLYPLLPHEGVLWIFRLAMSTALVIHLICAWSLWRRGAATRTVGAKKQSFRGLTARLMLPTGLVLLAFVIVHLLDLTLGMVVASSTFQHPDPLFHVAANVVASLSRPLMAATYLLSLLALAFHLAHGLPQAWQDLGGASPISRKWVHALSGIFVLLIVVGDGAVVVYALITGGAW